MIQDLNDLRDQLEQYQIELQASKTRFRNIIERNADGIVIVDREGIVRFANSAAGVLWDCRPEELLGKPFGFPAVAGERTDIDVWRRQDETISVEMRVVDTEWDGKTAYVASLRDMTGRKRAEDEIRFQAQLLDVVEQAVVALDFDHNIIYWNRFAERLFGWSAAETIGRNALELISTPELREHIANLMSHLRQGRSWTDEFLVWRRDGAPFLTLCTGTPIYDEDEKLAGGVIVAIDITARKQAEEEIQRRNRELALLNRVIAASTTSPKWETVLEIACQELARAFNLPRAVATLVNEEMTEAVVVAEYPAADHLWAVGRRVRLEGNPTWQFLVNHKASLVLDDDPRSFRLETSRRLLVRQPLTLEQDGRDLNSVSRVMRQNSTLLSAFSSCSAGVVPPQNWADRPSIESSNGRGQTGIDSMLLLPIIVNGQVCGSLELGALTTRHFLTEEIDLAWSVADQIAGAWARARINDERRRLSAAIEQTADSVIITDTQGIILYVNPAFERITGYSRAEAVGQNLRILKSGKQNKSFYEEMWQTVSAGDVWHGRIVNKKKNGQSFTVDATITPVRDESHKIINYVGVERDVTHELYLEEQYRQAQKMEAVGLLAGGIAHDFNNLLTAINGFAELLKTELAPDDPLQDLVERIAGSGERAADLVRQLLAFSRKQVIEPTILDLNEVVADMQKLLQRIIGENIRMETELAPNLWPVKVDLAQLEQVIVNLAVNARDAMPHGGSLTIRTANRRLEALTPTGSGEIQPGEYVMLEVTDTGVGMTEQVKDRLFEPFFTTKEVGKGTGLGLATVFGIVKQSNGHITVESREEVGTSFILYLPRVQANGVEVQDPRRPRKSSAPPGSETILLVEDDAYVRELARRVLHKQGYILLEAGDGQEALQVPAAHPGPIHLLLTDVIMPGMSGKELADQLAQIRPGVKTLFISGYAENVLLSKGVLTSRIAFLQKPFSPSTLAAKVREVLDGSQSQRIGPAGGRVQAD